MNQELMTLDFWQDTVICEGKTFPIGTLACDALNVPVNTIAKINEQNENLNNEGVSYMEQLLIVEDDIGLNQGYAKR